jgi:hypothetical protein
MKLVKVGGKFTIENTMVVLTLTDEEVNNLASNIMFTPEFDDYTKKREDFKNLIQGNSLNTSRRLVLSYPVLEDSENHCITLIQVLLGRELNKLIVYLRSSDSARISSDLGFICKLAKMVKGAAIEVNIIIGSFHTYVESI